MTACPPCEICSHHHFPTDPCWECSSGEACRLDRHLPGRPDAAAPCHHEYDDFGNCEYCGKNRFVAAPSSDAAQPVAWTWTTIDRVTGSKRRHTSFDKPCPDAYTRDVCALVYAHPEDAPEGPRRVTDEMIRAALATELEDGPISQDIGFGMMRMILENALNRDVRDRLKGDEHG